MEDIRLLPVTIGTRAMHSDLPEDDDDKFWVRITATNAEVDLHNSIMDPKTTLPNFEKEAKTKPGVALKDHHGYKSFGYGRSANAMLNEDNELMIDFFILKNMEYTDYSLQFKSSEQLIRAIEHELVNQASIGFFGAREICNLCKLPIRRYSYWDWDEPKEERCSHKMGKEYDVGDGKMETARYTVYDGHLKEVSLVEFASNRQTSIDKKREMDEMGRHIETLCRSESKKFMEELLMTDQEWITKLRDALEIPTVKSTDEPDTVVQKLQEEITTLRSDLGTEKDKIATMTETHKTDLAALEVDAEDGKAYRQARIDEALKQGNRAYGDDFDEEYHRVLRRYAAGETRRRTSPRTRKRGMRCYQQADRRRIRMNRRRNGKRSVCVNGNGGCVGDKQSRLETLSTRFTQEV